MAPTLGPTGNILASAIALYLSAMLWAAIAGPDRFLTGMLSGAGSIALGVWLGVVLTTRPPKQLPPIDEDW